MSEPRPSPQPLSLYPLLFIAASFAGGICLVGFIPLPLKVTVPLLVGAGAMATKFLLDDDTGRASVTVLAAFFVAGMVCSTVETRLLAGPTVQQLYDSGTIPSGDPVEVTGTLARAPEPATDGFFVLLRVESVRYAQIDHAVAGTVWLFAPVEDAATLEKYTQLEPRYGARMRVLIALKRADQYRNPGVSSFTEYLDQRGYDATGTIKHPGLIERLDDARVFLPLAWLYEARQRLLAAILTRFDQETAGVLAASMLGNRYFLSSDTSERFRSGGTFHVLIISGLHISAIGLFALWIMRKLTKNRWWQYLVPVGLVWAYAAAVGGESAIVRAALMFTAAGASFVIFRKANGLNALGGAALLLLIVHPAEVFSPSFQLTFIAVLAIVGLALPVLLALAAIGKWRPSAATPVPPIAAQWLRSFSEVLFWSERGWRAEQARSAWKCRLFKSNRAVWLERWHLQRPLRVAFEGVFVSLCVQLALLPFLIVYFHRLAPISLILNLFVGILMAGMSVFAFLALLASMFGTHAALPFVFLTNKINWLMTHIGDPVLRREWATWRLPQYSGGKVVVYVVYLLVLALIGYLAVNWDPFALPPSASGSVSFQRRLPIFSGMALTALAIVVIAHPFSAVRPDGRLRVDFLDVGQGDSMLVTLPDGKKLLIDGGGQSHYGDPGTAARAGSDTSFRRDERNIGEAVVSEYLWYRGFDSVDLVLATHSDTDHMDGLNAVVKNFRVGAALVGSAPATDDDFIRLSGTLHDRGVPLYLVKRNDVLHFGDVTIEFLWPNGAALLDSTTNNESVVTRISMGSRVFLLTGDIEKPTEDALVAEPANIKCDVLKVAHHGSRTSSSEEFLTAAKPTVAVISVGLTSIFGHPHPEVVERLRATGARVMTTGRSGTITISTDGNDLQVSEFVH